MPKESKEQRQRKNKARREALKAKKNQSYRRKNQIGLDEEEVNIAPLWRRVVQFCIDQTMLGFFVTFTYVAFALIYDLANLPPLLAVAPQIIFGVGYLIPIVALKGQTYGMKKLNVMVLNKDGTALISKWRSALRWFILFGLPNSYFMVQPGTNALENLVYVGILSISTTLAVVSPMLVTKDRRGLHDLVSGTIMIQIPKVDK